MSQNRIPPIQCLLTFETLARLRSVTQTAEELCVTPSAVSHRVKQLEQIIGTKQLVATYLDQVRPALARIKAMIQTALLSF